MWPGLIFHYLNFCPYWLKKYGPYTIPYPIFSYKQIGGRIWFNLWFLFRILPWNYIIYDWVPGVKYIVTLEHVCNASPRRTWYEYIKYELLHFLFIFHYFSMLYWITLVPITDYIFCKCSSESQSPCLSWFRYCILYNLRAWSPFVVFSCSALAVNLTNNPCKIWILSHPRNCLLLYYSAIKD